MKDDLLRQALNALEHHTVQTRPIHNTELAIDALRAELAQPAHAPDDVGLLEYKGNSVSFIYQKMTAYRGAIDDAWKALSAAHMPPDGTTTVAKMIGRLAAAPIVPADWVTVPKKPPPDFVRRVANHGVWSDMEVNNLYADIIAAAPGSAPAAPAVPNVRNRTSGGPRND